MNITTIFFDFVGVLLERNPSAIVSEQVEMIDQMVGQVVNDRQFRESVLIEHGLSDAQFNRVLDQVVDRYQPFEPLWQMLPDLRERYALGIINNGTWLTYPRFNAKYGIDRNFDVFVSSAVQGVRKPDSQIYLRACEKLGVLPDQCIFMDDSKANVASAVQLGMQGIWWETHEKGLEKFRTWVKSKNELD